MKQQHTYEKLIREKLNALPTPDVAGLWDSMESILDKEMPQPEGKKRRFAFWGFSNYLLIAATVLFVVGGTFTVYKVADHMAVAMENNTAVVKHNTAANRQLNHAANRSTTNDLNSVNNNNPSTINAGNAVPSGSGDNNNYNNTNNSNNTVNNTNGIGNTNTVSNKNKTINSQISSGSNTTAPLSNTVAVNKNNFTNRIVNSASGFNLSTNSVANKNSANTNSINSHNVGLNTNGVVNNSAAASDNGLAANHPPVIETLPTLVNGAEVQLQTLKAADFAIGYPAKKRVTRYLDKGIAFGIGLNYPFTVNGQKKNELDLNGKNGSLFGYMPSVYAQYHFSKKFYVQAEWQPVNPQYTPNFTLYDKVWLTYPNIPEEKDEKLVKLNKLFYTSVPVTAYYSPIKNVTVGAGVQYSRLKKVVLQDQEYHHTWSLYPRTGEWTIQQTKNEVAVKNPNDIQHSSGDIVDSVASSIKKQDVRLLADVNYNYKGISLGVRYAQGVNNYVNSKFTGLPVKDKNESVQLYLRVNLFDGRKRRN